MAPRTIDGFEFAETGAQLSGAWPAADLPRLQDVLRSNAGQVGYALQGTHDALGRPAIGIELDATLELTCQRCLGALALPVRVREVLVLARSEAEADAAPLDPEGPDRIVAGRHMPVRELIEDELLLAVPLAPRHEQCAAGEPRGKDKGGSPFAGLRGMLKQGN